MIEARIYDQEGNLQPFNMSESRSNALFAEFLRVHDRYTVHGEDYEIPTEIRSV